MNIFLSNDTLYLRAPEPEDLDIMYDIENDTSVWDIGCTTVPFSRYSLREYIQNTAHDIFADRQLRLMVIRKDDNKTLGIIDLADFDPLNNRAAVGIIMLSAYRKEGYATDAIRLLCTYCFEYLSLKQLYAYIPVENGASRKLFSKCGFEESGILKDWLKQGHSYKDACLMQYISPNK